MFKSKYFARNSTFWLVARISGAWFFLGMPLSMIASACYFSLAIPLPPLFYFLTGFIYLNGAFLGGLWGTEQFLRSDASRWDRVGAVLVFGASLGCIITSLAFALIGLRHW